MLPTQDTTIATDAGNLLTSRYKDQPVISGLVKAFALRIQEIENSFWDFINAVQLSNHPMAGGPWNILDQLGAIVVAPRNGLTDPDYLAFIKLKARINRARGLSEDVLGLAALMTGVLPPLYIELFPAAFYLGAWNIALSYPLFAPLLSQARPAGVFGLFAYSTWPDGNDFSFTSVYDSTAGEAGYGSVYNSSVGGLLVAGVQI